MPQHRVAVSRSGEFARLFVKNKATARDDRVFIAHVRVGIHIVQTVDTLKCNASNLI
jgi:hypothetical protein